MAIYTVELDGNQFDIEGPDGASEDDLLGAARAHAASAAPAPAPEAPAPESKGRQFVRKVANALPTAGAVAVPTIGAISTSGLSLPATAGLAGVGAAGGTAAKQLILRALGDKEGVPQTSGEAAKDIGIAGAKDAAITMVGGKILKTAGKGLRLAKDLVTKPGAQEVAQMGKEALADISTKGGERLAAARLARDAAKTGLIDAEEKAGLHFSSSVEFESLLKNPKEMADFASAIGRLARKSPEELAQQLSSNELQFLRKVAQEGEKGSGLSDIANSHMRQGKDVVTRALGLKEKGIGEALGKFRASDKTVGEIPRQIKDEIVSKKLANSKDLIDAKSLDRKRKVIKGLVGAGATYAAIKSLIN